MDLQIIQTKIFEVRDARVMKDFHLAELYQVETRVLKQAVKRNIEHFPDDFMFQLRKEEWQQLITNCDKLREAIQCWLIIVLTVGPANHSKLFANFQIPFL
jgi:hypothetical protein